MLVLQKSDRESYCLFTKGEHSIGRQGDLKLNDDRSISRQHAIIRITVKNGQTKITLQDLGSTTGTYMNDSSSRISLNTVVVLKIGDKIKFGALCNVWTLMEKPFVVCVSKLSMKNRATLKRQLLVAKGSMVTDWSGECTHLTMDYFDTTVKAMCALAQAKPIVTLAYWEHLISVFNKCQETSLPCCDNFTPDATADWLKMPGISFKLNISRINLFDGLKFIVFDHERLETLQKTVEAAGGKIIDGFNQKVSAEEIRLKKAVLLQPKTETNNRSLSNIRKVLNTHHLRPINESEIFLSVIRCSLDKYCNPSFDMASVLQMSEPQTHVGENNATILATETQDSSMLADMQYSETGSGNFSLTLNDGIDDSENEIISDTEPIVINDSDDESKIGRGAVKRKYETSKDTSLFKAKNRKIDYWLVRSSQRTGGDSNNAGTSGVESSSCDVKKEVIDTNSKKKTETFHPSSLFGSMNARKTNSFNSDSTSTTSFHQQPLFNFGSKRKLKETMHDIPPLKKKCPLTLILEPEMSGSKKKESIVGSDSPEDDSSSKKLLISRSSNFPCSQVDVPTTISLSQFIDVKARGEGCSNQVKEESKSGTDELSFLQTVHKPIIKVESLIKFSTAPDSTHQTCANNFKKFRKSQVCYPTCG